MFCLRTSVSRKIKGMKIKNLSIQTAILALLSFCLSALAATNVVPFSQEPRASVINSNDDVIINSTNNGTATWTTKRATVSTLVTASLPSILPTVTNVATAVSAASAVSVMTDYQLMGDTNALFYCQLASVQDRDSRESIAGWIAEIKRGGLWPALIDAGFLKTNLGASASSIYSLFGKPCYQSNLTFTSFGASFQGSILAISNGLPDMRTNTLVAVCRFPGQSEAYNGSGSIIGVYGNGTSSSERLPYRSYLGPTLKENGSESSAANTYANGSYSSSQADYSRHVVASTFSGTNVYCTLDGMDRGVAGNAVSPSYQVTHPLTNLFLGDTPGRADALTGEIGAWALFNTVLTINQLQTVERAFRWLEASRENDIFIGDSQTIPNGVDHIGGSSFLTNGWPQQFMRMGRNADNVCYWIEGQNGSTSQGWDQGTVLTNRLALSGLGGKCNRVRVFLLLGANDEEGSFTSSNSISYQQSLMSKIRQAGAEVWLLTQNTCADSSVLPSGYGWLQPQDLQRQAVNQWIRAHPELYSALIDRDLLFTRDMMNNTNAATTNTSLDGLHLSTYGNTLQAQQASQKDAGRNLVSATYDAAGNVVGRVSPGATTFSGLPFAFNPLFQDCIFAAPLSGTLTAFGSAGSIGMMMGTSGYFTNGLMYQSYSNPDLTNNAYLRWSPFAINLTNFSVAVLVNTTQTNLASYFVVNGNDPSYLAVPFKIYAYPVTGGSFMQFLLVGSNSTSQNLARMCTTNYNWADGNWHLVAGTYDGLNTSLYIDGLSAVNSNLLAQFTGPCIDGSTYKNLAGNLLGGGKIQYPMVFNHCLSTNEVNMLRTYFLPSSLQTGGGGATNGLTAAQVAAEIASSNLLATVTAAATYLPLHSKADTAGTADTASAGWPTTWAESAITGLQGDLASKQNTNAASVTNVFAQVLAVPGAYFLSTNAACSVTGFSGTSSTGVWTVLLIITNTGGSDFTFTCPGTVQTPDGLRTWTCTNYTTQAGRRIFTAQGYGLVCTNGVSRWVQ
jgi:hypothetical protein